MNERYWVEQIAKKEARINELEEQRVEAEREGNYYKGLYLGLKESMTEVVVLDETFEDVLPEEPKKKSKKK